MGARCSCGQCQTLNVARSHLTGKTFIAFQPNLPQINHLIWHSNGYVGSSLMSTRMDILFPYKIKFPTHSTLCLISTMLLQTVSVQTSITTSALPSVQSPRESATAHCRLSHSARLLQQSLCLTCHQQKEWASKSIF